MPVIHEISGPNETFVRVWELTESIDSITNELGEELTGTLRKDIRNTNRLNQRLGFYLLHKKYGQGSIVAYNGDGKPYPTNGIFELSVSHTDQYIAYMTSAAPCGVDIETITSKVTRIAHKFLTDEEMRIFQFSDPVTATRLWCAKEALYKVAGTKSMFLRTNIFVQPDPSSDSLIGKIITDEKTFFRKVNFFSFKNVVLAWTETLQ